MAHGMWQCGVSHAQNSYWRWRCTIMGKKPWVIIYAKIWSKEMAKFLPNEKHQNQFQKSSEMVAPFGRFVRFNEGHKFEPPKTNPPSIWQLEHRNAFGFWDGGDDDGCCLVPTCSFFNHSCEPNCLHRMEHGEVRFYALRDIATDEELTFSYLDQAEVGHEWWVCRCFFFKHHK